MVVYQSSSIQLKPPLLAEAFSFKEDASMTFEMALGEANILLDMKPDCKACGMGIACCGCPKDRKYRTERKAFLNDLKGDIVSK